MQQNRTRGLTGLAALVALIFNVACFAGPTPVITAAYGTSGLAPYTVHVHGLNTGHTVGNSLTALYEWDFGDSNGIHNKIIGTSSAHIFDNPGTYTVRLTVTDEAGAKASTTLTVNVASDTRQTIYVASNGNDSNPGTQSSPIRTVARASAMMGANKKFLFRRGDTFDMSDDLYINHQNVTVGAYGSGNRPVFRWTTGSSGWPALILMHDQSRAVVVEDIAFSSNQSPNTGAPRGIYPQGQNITVRRCTFSNLSDAMNAEGTVWGWLTVANTAEIMSGYFVWGQGADHTHFDNVSPGSLNEHTMRNAGVTRFYVGYNNFSNTVKTNLWCMLGSDAYVAHNTFSVGRMIVGPNFAFSPASERFPRAIVEANTILDTQIIMYPGAEHLMFRNNVVESQSLEAFSIWGWQSGINRTVDDVRILNNTGINDSNQYGKFIKIGDGATHITAINNLYVAPNLNSQWAAANAYTDDNNLDTNYFHSNLWASPRTGTAVHFFTSTGYLPTQWDALPQVGSEQYRLFNASDLNSSFRPMFNASVGIRATGVHTDFNDAYRPTGNVFSVGAVELNPVTGPPPPPPPPPSNSIVFNMENGTGWAVQSSALSDGAWERGVPAGDGTRGDPTDDYDNSGSCWLTANRANNSDVDGGPTIVTSPTINASAGNNSTIVSCAVWFYNQNAADEDRLRIEISNDNGQTWRFVHNVNNTSNWQVVAFRLTEYVAASSQVKLRFNANDNPNDSVTEAGLDDLRVCFSGTCATVNVTREAGDVDNNSTVNINDMLEVLGKWGSCSCPADLDRNGVVNISDLMLVLNNWG